MGTDDYFYQTNEELPGESPLYSHEEIRELKEIFCMSFMLGCLIRAEVILNPKNKNNPFNIMYSAVENFLVMVARSVRDKLSSSNRNYRTREENFQYNPDSNQDDEITRD